MEPPCNGRREKAMPSPDTRGYKIKKSGAGMGYLSSSCQCSFTDPAQTWQVAVIALGFPPDLHDKTIDADPAHLGPETWRNRAGPDLESSSPLSSFNSNERFNATRGEKSSTVLPCNRTLQD